MNEQTNQTTQDTQNSQNQGGYQKPYNLEPNVEAVISYIPFIGGIFIYVTEKENKFVRFHAVQSVLFWLVALGVSGIITSLKFIFIGFLIEPIFQFALVALWFFLMYKAYNNQEYELPIIGKIAKDQVYK